MLIASRWTGRGSLIAAVVALGLSRAPVPDAPASRHLDVWSADYAENVHALCDRNSGTALDPDCHTPAAAAVLVPVPAPPRHPSLTLDDAPLRRGDLEDPHMLYVDPAIVQAADAPSDSVKSAGHLLGVEL